MVYLDTSFVLAALLNEDMTANARDRLRGYQDGGIAVSNWTTTEVHSALGVKVRTGGIDMTGMKKAIDAYRLLTRTGLSVIDVPQEAFSLAVQFMRNPHDGLRGGDALHLAIARLRGFAIATYDIGMQRAAILHNIVVDEG